MILREWVIRLWGSLRRGRATHLEEAALEEEVRLHLELAAEDQGRRAAALQMGGVTQAMDALREQRTLPWLNDLLHDLRYSVRTLRREPLFAAVAVLTLGLGVGATTAIFGVVNGVLIKPLPYPHPEQVVGVWHSAPGIHGLAGGLGCSPSMYFTYREENRSFEHFGLWNSVGASVTGVAEPELPRALSVTYGVLDALGVKPLLGRWFSQADDTPGSAETVILTYGYWQRRFGGDRSIVGRTLTIDSTPHTVIGVMPEEFRFQRDPDLILPQRLARDALFLGPFSSQGIARLKPGVTLAQANADVGRMLGIWLNAWPATPGFSLTLFQDARLGPALQPLKQEIVGDVGTALWVVMGTLGLVLLIACANVSNLLLVRAEARQHELAIRAVLGAGWGRIARAMLVESLTLGVLGGVFGAGLAYAALRILVANGPDALPRLRDIGIDPLVLAFALGVSLLSGALFGVVPVLKYAGPRIASALYGVSRTFSHGPERHRARNTLVVVQVALALVLLIGSGLMIRTFQHLRHVQPGFTRPEEVQVLHSLIPEATVQDPERVMRMQHEILDKLAALPGVASVGFADSAPLESFLGGSNLLFAEDKTYAEGQVPPIRRIRRTAPGFFGTLGTPIVAGRDFTWTDLYDRRYVAIVSENLAREWWGDPRAALGKRIHENPKHPWREIVGVAADVYDNGVHVKPPGVVYWPVLMAKYWDDEHDSVVRAGMFAIRSNRTGSEGLVAEAQQVIWSVNGRQPVFLVTTLKTLYDQSMARTSFTLVMLAIAGGMALALGIVGIYGVIAYAVSQRTREIGIRTALGAQRGALLGMFVRHGLLLAGTGAAVGVVAATGLSRLMSSLLFGVTALDPATYVAVSVLLVVAAVVASYLPARRALGVDPVQALRAE